MIVLMKGSVKADKEKGRDVYNIGKRREKVMGEKIRGERLRILIVDDAEVNRIILMDMLEADYEILEAENGEQALEILKEQGESIDLVLLDFIMPGINGFEVLKEMNRHWWKADIPVIMISAENDRNFVVQAYKLGAVDYISRPFDGVIVRHRVDGVMRMHQQEKYFSEIAAAQIMEKYQNNNMLMHILSGIVEFRNGESAAQVVSLADVYDALTSDRCYKKAFSHEQSMEMILNNECGVFNPLLLDCLRNLDKEIPDRMNLESAEHINNEEIKRIIEETLRPGRI